MADTPTFGDQHQPPRPPSWAPPSPGRAIPVPPGHVPYTAPSVAPPSTLRKWTVGLAWAEVAGSAGLAVAQITYASVVEGFRDGSRSFGDLDAAEQRLVVVLLTFVALSLASLIVRSIWSLRTVRNARERDRWTRLSPGMACGGWYIPIGAYWLPWQQLRRATRRFGGRTAALNWWQGLWIASSARFSFTGSYGGSSADIDRAVSVAATVGAVMSVIATLLLAVSAMAATVATRDVDAATSATAPPLA